MTVIDALAAIRRVGDVSVEGGKIRLRIPESDQSKLGPAIATLRRERETVLQHLGLKGMAVELWRAGDRFFIVTGDSDRAAVVAGGIGRQGETWTAGEVELVAQVSDQDFRDEVERWKRAMDGKIRAVSPPSEVRR
jgi:hypothetical protein